MKNRALIITVAGTCTRFRESIGRNVLKCTYSEKNHPSILARLVNNNEKFFGKIIVVGGHLFSELEKEVKTLKSTNVSLIYNEHYSDWGSNYSLYLGLVEALNDSTIDEIVFAEGDLVLDEISLQRVIESPKSVVTANRDPIHAVKSVAVFQTLQGKFKFIYDPNHRQFSIDGPFVSIANSGQVWKFMNVSVLKNVMSKQNEDAFRDNNLNIVQKYFDELPGSSVEMLYFNEWHNCNTVEDYRRAFNGTKP